MLEIPSPDFELLAPPVPGIPIVRRVGRAVGALRRRLPLAKRILVVVSAAAVAGLVLVAVVDALRPNHRGEGFRARERKDYAEAERQYRLAVEESERKGDPLDLPIDLEGLARTLAEQQKYTEADQFYWRALGLYAEAASKADPHSSAHLMYTQATRALASSYIDRREWSLAAGLLEKALRLEEEYSIHMQSIGDFVILAELHRAQRKFEDADRVLKWGMGNMVATGSSESIPFAECLEERAALYRQWNHADAYMAPTWEASARAIRARFKAKNPGAQAAQK